jgi:hypothetical protein
MSVWFETHQDHYVCEMVFSPAAEPADLPIIEAGANRNGRFQSQKLCLGPHARRTFMAPWQRTVKPVAARNHVFSANFRRPATSCPE